MPAGKQQISIGFQGGQVLAVRVTDDQLKALNKALGEVGWHELASEIDVIVHSGALTEWGQPWERYQTVNIDGTRRVPQPEQTKEFWVASDIF